MMKLALPLQEATQQLLSLDKPDLEFVEKYDELLEMGAGLMKVHIH